VKEARRGPNGEVDVAWRRNRICSVSQTFHNRTVREEESDQGEQDQHCFFLHSVS
jgi:hypothetical protein